MQTDVNPSVKPNNRKAQQDAAAMESGLKDNKEMKSTACGMRQSHRVVESAGATDGTRVKYECIRTIFVCHQ